jgi:muramidase (phage lysozyme)
MASFIFDPSKGETPETLARQRAILDAMLQNSQGVPQTLGEGIASIGQALSARLGYAALAKKEAAAKAAGDAAFGNIAGAMAGKSAFPPAPGSSSAAASSGGADYHGDQLAWTDAAPYQKALLNTIAGPESGGKYNVIYGGGTFDDFSHHPNQPVRIQTGPNAGRTSSAAGKYQFLGPTWDDQAKKLGLPDFQPVNQDKAAWNLAAETYKAKTGQDLATVLQSGDPQAIAGVGSALSGIWTSLPGGIEQGTNVNRFVATYQRALGAGATPAQATAVAQQTTQPKPVQVASLDPSAGVSSIDPYGRIPATDTRGEDQRAKFRQWNSNPVANEAANEAAIDPALAGVVDRAKQIAGTNFVIGSGRRDAGMQQKAVDWGWSKTNDSDHLGGGAVDLWPVDANGQVVFDPQKQAQIVQAMKQAAKEKGVDLDPGADWSRFKDVPHFGMVGQTPLDNAPIPTPRPGDGGGVQVASLDPSAGVTGYAPGAPGATTPAGQRVLAAMMSKQPMGGPVASLQPSAGAVPDAAPSAIPVPAAPAQQRIVQAMQDNLPVMAGGDAGAIQWDQNGGPSVQTLMQAANSAPYMNDTQKAILGALIKQKIDPDAALDTEYKRAQIKNIESEIAKRNDPNARDKFGNNPVWGKDKNGKWVLFQLNNAGGLAPAAAPDGIDLVPPGVGQLDLGTSFGIRDRAGAIIGDVPKDVSGEAAQKEIGKSQGAAQFDLPRIEDNAAMMTGILDRMKTHPGRAGSTGFIEGMLPSRTADQVDFQSLVNETKGQAFLQAYQTLKGAGQISEAEGAKAEQALSRLGNQRISDEEYLRAIDDFEGVIRTGLARARKQAGVPEAGAGQPQSQDGSRTTSGGLKWSIEP